MSGAPEETAKISLEAMTNLCNVNAVPDGSGLSFGSTGLTLIYGENASGKSAYARVLKRACSARHKEPIHPNVHKRVPATPAKALFRISLEGHSGQLVPWEDGGPSPSVLTNICVFDSKCARIIVNEKNEVVYLPYGSDVFQGLVNLLQHLRQRLEQEKPSPEKLIYQDIPKETSSGQFMNTLIHTTPVRELEQRTKWNPQDEQKLSELTRTVAKVEAEDPTQQAVKLRNQKGRIIELKTEIDQIASALSEEKAGLLLEHIRNHVTAEKAFLISSQTSLADEPLHGAGETEWQKLYEAAEEYSTQIAYKNIGFPNTAQNSLCVLCMQPLSEDARQRFNRFKEFMERTTKKSLDCASDMLKRTLKQLEDADFPEIESYKDALDEIRNREDQLSKQIEDCLLAMLARKMSMIHAGTSMEIRDFPPNPPNPSPCIAKVAETIEKEAAIIEKTANPQELSALRTEKAELQARKNLSERKSAILNYLDSLRTENKYDECLKATSFKHITNKGKTIVSEFITDRLKDCLDTELKYFGLDLALELKPSGVEGETIHELKLAGCQLPPKAAISDILSEGEQKALALSAFLAELKACQHESPIVLDDPVCSLDHQWRRKTAARIVHEAKSRQLIIFTHDIVFAHDIMDDVARENVPLCVQYIYRTAGIPGYADTNLPWGAGTIAHRLDELKKLCSKAREIHTTATDPEYSELVSTLYSKLRATWERAVEDVAFCRTLLRHRDHISVNLEFRKVSVLDLRDCEDLINAHKKCCDITESHDLSRARGPSLPNPTEISTDIASLEDWITRIKDKQKTIV
jgi:energy-coupling factor transporter ATP-binding protein EcfA2